MKFLNQETIAQFPYESFLNQWPFPYLGIEGMLTEEGFQTLIDDFPSLDLFTYHQDVKRAYGQRPHNRYYLAYEETHYKRGEKLDKEVSSGDLPKNWVSFIKELQEDTHYQDLIKKSLGTDSWKVRFAWHVGQQGNEVSPHLDNIDKLGTHIFYFNTDQNWKEEWGGQIVALGGKMTNSGNPEYGDFADQKEISIMNNRSFLFKNNLDAWHGVRPLKCPEGKFRRLFNVIYQPIASP